jgi:nucleotide-binding universal stress UspA family protein
MKTILIPVDFSSKTATGIKKAVGFAAREETELHLLHVTGPGHGPKHSFKLWSVEKEFEELRQKIREQYPSARIKTHVLQGHSVQKMIIECIQLLNPVLVIIAKADPPPRWLLFGGISPGVIAKQSNCPVLTVKPGSAETKTQVILVPIRNFLPQRKLEWAVLLAKKYKARVHLLVIQDRQSVNGSSRPQVFLKAYDQLRETLHQQIEYSVTDQQDTAKATLDHAKAIMADLILVNPGTESRSSGLFASRHISDRLRVDSGIQVLDVEPYKELIPIKQLP